MKWKPHNNLTWSLTVGAPVKLHASGCGIRPEFAGREGVVERAISRYGQKNVVVNFGDKSYRIPLEWVESCSTPTIESIDKVLKKHPQPNTSQNGDFDSEVKEGDWVLMDRGGKKFDAVQFKSRKDTRVSCFDPKTGKSYGYDPKWYVCKIQDEGRLG